jgi:hypothetical protein
MHEEKRKEKEKTTEVKQITARKPKGNKRKRKNQTSLHLLGIEPATHLTHLNPATPLHSLPHLHLPSTIYHLPSPSSTSPIYHLLSTTSHLPLTSSQHIHTSRLTHTHPPEKIPRSIYIPCCSMKHRPEATHTMEAR